MATYIRSLKDFNSNTVYPRTSIDAVLGIQELLNRFDEIIRGCTAEGSSYGMSEVIDARVVHNRGNQTLKKAIESVDDGVINIADVLLTDLVVNDDFNFRFGDLSSAGKESSVLITYKSVISDLVPVRLLKFLIREDLAYTCTLYFFSSNSEDDFVGYYQNVNDYILTSPPVNAEYFRVYLKSPVAELSHDVDTYLQSCDFKCYGYSSNSEIDSIAKVLETYIMRLESAQDPNTFFVLPGHEPEGYPKLICSENSLYLVKSISIDHQIMMSKICSTDYISKTEVETLVNDKQNIIHEVSSSVIVGNVNPQGDGTAYINIISLDYELVVGDIIYDTNNRVFYKVDEVTSTRYNLLVLGGYIQLAKEIVNKQLINLPVLDAKIHTFNDPVTYGNFDCDGYVLKSDLPINLGNVITRYYGAFVLTVSGNLYYIVTSDYEIDPEALIVKQIAGYSYLLDLINDLPAIQGAVPSSRTIGGVDLSSDWSMDTLGAQVFYALAKVAGDTTQASSQNPPGTYTANAQQKIQEMIGIVSSEGVEF